LYITSEIEISQYDRGLIGKYCWVSRSVIETSDRVDVYRSTSASSLSLGPEKVGIYTHRVGRW